MVRIEGNKVIIEITDDQPEDFVQNYQCAVARVVSVAIDKPDELNSEDVYALQTLLLSFENFKPPGKVNASQVSLTTN